MAPHDLPFGYDPDVSSGDVAFHELEAIGNFYYTNFDFELDEPLWEGGAVADEEDWESEYPASTPYVPTPEVLARVDELIRELVARANVLAFGTAEPRDEHYDEFFRHFGRSHRGHSGYHHHHHDEEDSC